MKGLKRILDKIEHELIEIKFLGGPRNKLSVSLFFISLDHAKAIVKLMNDEKPIISSSYALVRPMFECFLRAAWILHCATDTQIINVIEDDKWPKINNLLKSVNKKNEWPDRLKNIWESELKEMHSYTHGGIKLLRRWYKDGAYEHELDFEINRLDQFLALILFLNFFQIVLVADTREKDDFIEDLSKEIITNYLS